MTILLLSDLTNADLIPVTNKKQKDHLLGVIWRDELMYGYRKAPAATF